MIASLQRRLTYLPTQQVPPASSVLERVEEVTYPTGDGLELTGWFVAPSRRARRSSVIVAPGNGGNRALRAPLARSLADAGMATLLVEYRGYGGNPGSPHEEGLHEDLTAARRYLAARPEVDEQRVVLLGESLGAAVVVRSAVEGPPAAVVLRSPFTSLADVASHHYPFLPVRALLRERYPTIERIAELHVPLLVVAGGDDRIVPLEQSRRVFETAPGPKRFVAVPGAGHNDVAVTSGDELVEAVVELVDEHVEAT